MDDLNNTTDIKKVIINLIIVALGLYLATTFSDAVTKTFNSILPKTSTSQVKSAWISAAISFVIVITVVILINRYINKKGV